MPFRVLILLLLIAAPAQAQWGVGVHAEHNSSFQPGIEAFYQFQHTLGGHPRLTLSYNTSRVWSAASSNDLAKDRIELGTGWFFRPGRSLRPYVQLDLGYERFDREDEELFALLDNDAWIVSLLGGLSWQHASGVGVYGDVGLSFLQSSTVYPFLYSVGLNYRLP